MIERLNPKALHPPVGQSIIVISNYKRTAYFTANPLDADGNLVGGNDFAKQADQVFKNIGIVFKELEVDHRNVIKMTGYIVDFDPVFHGVMIADWLAENPPEYEYPATMLMSVQSLARSEILFELELIIGLD